MFLHLESQLHLPMREQRLASFLIHFSIWNGPKGSAVLVPKLSVFGLQVELPVVFQCHQQRIADNLCRNQEDVRLKSFSGLLFSGNLFFSF